LVENAISTLGGILDDYHPVEGLEEQRKKEEPNPPHRRGEARFFRNGVP
jgi:hypothetical protein